MGSRSMKNLDGETTQADPREKKTETMSVWSFRFTENQLCVFVRLCIWGERYLGVY